MHVLSFGGKKRGEEKTLMGSISRKRKLKEEPRSPPLPSRPIESFRYIPLYCGGNLTIASLEDNAAVGEEELKAEKGKAVIPPRSIESYRYVPRNKAEMSTCSSPAPIASASVLKHAASGAAGAAAAFTSASRRKASLTAGKEDKKGVRKEKAPTLNAEQKRVESYRRIRQPTTWKPPRSPHNLLQESYYKSPWKVLVICMLCNKTAGKQAEGVLRELFTVCPSAMAAVQTPSQVIKEIIRPLGLQNERALRIKFFSLQYLDDSWEYVTELYGVGKYAADAYAIFCKGSWQNISPCDHKLVDYWLFLNEHFGFIDDARAVKYQVETSEDSLFEI